jgi:hypothetical protein
VKENAADDSNKFYSLTLQRRKSETSFQFEELPIELMYKNLFSDINFDKCRIQSDVVLFVLGNDIAKNKF